VALRAGESIELGVDLVGIGVPGSERRVDLGEIPAVGRCLSICRHKKGGGYDQ
jgi:hypothetical protein